MQDNDHKEMRDLMKAHTDRDPGSEYWDSYTDRLKSRMADEDDAAPVSPSFSLVEKLQELLQPTPRLAWQMSVAAILLFAGVLIGRNSVDETSPTIADSSETYVAPVTGDPESSPNDVELGSLDDAYSVLSTSRTLLLGMVNFDPERDDISLLSLDRRRSIATDLVSRTALLSNNLQDSDNLQLSQLISELEIILLEIANLDPEAVDIELIRAGVNRKSLLFKIDVAEMRHLDSVGDAQSGITRPGHTATNPVL